MRKEYFSEPAVFFDQDGTLSCWRWVDIDEVKKEGYFRSGLPHDNVITASGILTLMGCAVGTYGAAWLEDGHSVDDKDYWMDMHAPHIPKKNRIYVPCGSEKAAFFEEKTGRRITPSDILIDDNSDVLRSWESYGGTGIKVRTPENGRYGTWTGYSFVYDTRPQLIAEYILYIQKLRSLTSKGAQMASGM